MRLFTAYARIIKLASFIPEQVFERLYNYSPHAFWLDSSATLSVNARFSYMGDDSGPFAEHVKYYLKDNHLEVTGKKGIQVLQQDIFCYLQEQLALRKMEVLHEDFPFHFGYVGYLGYELKALTEGVTAYTAATPDAYFIFCDRMLVIDHEKQCYIAVALSDEAHEGEAFRWLDDVENAIQKLEEITPAAEVNIPSLTPRHNRENYLKLIDACKQELLQGNSYEICLTNQFTGKWDSDPLQFYLEKRGRNPVPYGAYLRADSLHVLCFSPERFLHIDVNGVVESKPIKGTIRRGDTPEEDARLKETLANSEKDRAENLMIVDLLRNDLSRVCEIGSMEVPSLFAIETYARVHQMVSTVRGKLRAGKTAIDCIRSAFPGGSMTGAPKHSSLAIIDRLEAGPRGIYSGAIGYLSLSGAASFNIVIRTIVIDRKTASIGAGGAITALSEPAQEWEEMMLKMQAVI